MANPFPSTEPAWGLRAYLILIGCAADRQTVTYDALAGRIKRGGPSLLAKPLALITRWCQHHSLPALASLVVEQATGLPAPGFAAVSRNEIPREQERAWALTGMRFSRRQLKNWWKTKSGHYISDRV
jgi:hypothetical protein